MPAEQGGDDPVSDCVELGDGGPDRGGHVLLLVPLGPHTSQTLVWQHFGKQSLEHREMGMKFILSSFPVFHITTNSKSHVAKREES